MSINKKSLISTVVLLIIIVVAITFIIVILRTGDSIDINQGVDLSGGVTYEKQVALTVNTNLKTYMDKEMSCDSVKTLINVAKTNNNDAKSNSDYKTVYFLYNGVITSPDELLELLDENSKYSASLSNNNKSDNEKDQASYYTNGQIKLITINEL